MDCLRNELHKEDKQQKKEHKEQLSKSMTEDLKNKEFLQKKAKLGDGTYIAAEDR